MTIAEQLHNSATHAAGIDPSCPVCNPHLLKSPPQQAAAPAPAAIPEGIGRDEAIAMLREALKARGMRYSVRGGRGTAWGWIEVDLLPSVVATLNTVAIKAAYRALGEAFGKPDGYSAVSIPASSAHYREYIQRAQGLTPDKIAEAYWD